jgi:hypothetical protein
VNEKVKTNKNFTIAYLLILGIVIGASVYAGAVVAPVTFSTQNYLTNNLSRFEEGLIMTQNFIGLKYFIIIAMIAIFLYEGYNYKLFKRELIKTLSALGAIMSGALFNFFYMSAIINMQMQGPSIVNDKIFNNMHKGSEIALVLFIIFCLILFVRTLQKELK